MPDAATSETTDDRRDVATASGLDGDAIAAARPHTRAMLLRDAASALLGMRVERDEDGIAVASLVVRPELTNGFAITHGGLVFALADTAFAIACNDGESVTVAQGADITFLKSTHVGQTLVATATRRTSRGRTGLYDVQVTDETGDVVAEFRGRSFTTARPFPTP
ncbi:hypothetical protein GCM10009846_27760 [Agrococcus versicolor]|uniref:Thioesterase domain-containing protein n=1 Tax=Agrococcus versicolor TaxID=501482 RepID=A0ABP5MN14_9MICO